MKRRSRKFKGLKLPHLLVVILSLVGIVSLVGMTKFQPWRINAAGGTAYYVSNTGDDANLGTSPSTPWASLTKVNSRAFEPGDTINFARGSSWVGELAILSSGVSGNPITFQSYGTGNSPKITNPGPLGSWTKDIVIKGSWIVVKDFLLADASETGVLVLSGAQNNVVSGVEATNVGFGIEVAGSNNLITGNYAHDLNMVVNTVGGDDDYGAVGFAILGPNNEVSYNRCINCSATSYDYGSDGRTNERYGTVDGSYIHHNYGRATNGFIEMGGGSAKNVRVSYNVSDHNLYDFACLHVGGTFGSVFDNFQIDNNTIIQTTSRAGDYVLSCIDSPLEPSQLYFRNNIVYSSGSMAASGTFTHTNNVYYMTGGSPVGYALGPGEIVADPLFVNLATGDYQLKPDSPAINAGTPLGFTFDFNKSPVPVGDIPDIGAYEYQGTTPSATTVTLYPVADAFVSKGSGSGNGSSKYLKVDGSPTQVTYIKFNLSSLAGKVVTSASLSMRVYNPSAATQTIYSVSDIAWQENSIKYVNRPALGPIVATLTGGAKGSWPVANLTGLIQNKAGQVTSIGINQTNSDELWLYSRETSSKPKLTVTYN